MARDFFLAPRKEGGAIAEQVPALPLRHSGVMTQQMPEPAKKSAAKIRVLRCLSDTCDAMLAYEVRDDNVLNVDLAHTARRDGDTRYFPCPSCGGRNVVEKLTVNGAVKHRVSRFEAGS